MSHGGAQVSALEPQPRDRCELVGGAEVLSLRAGDGAIDGGMCVAYGLLRPGRSELLRPVLADAHQQ